MSKAEVLHGDCLDVLKTLDANSVDAIVTDPPYFRVKADAWDRQWDKPAGFLRWLRVIRDEWHRVLKPNGSLYCFASPRMAARVETLIAGRFEVLNAIRWEKDAGWAKRQCKEEQRTYFPASETIIFAEHYGADNIAKGEAGYAAKCDELRGFVFEPLRAYLDGEREAAAFDFEMIRTAVGCAAGSGLPSHWFTRSQWMLPTEANYLKLRAATGRFQREYEDLRREYEDLRRPFSVTADVPYTDVWTFKTVNTYPGKHPCEKPLDLMRHIVTTSTRPGAVVLDCFAGSGSTGVACVQTGRDFIGIEREAKYVVQARGRLRRAEQGEAADMPLFAEAEGNP